MTNDLSREISAQATQISLCLFGKWVMPDSQKVQSSKWSSFVEELKSAGYTFVEPLQLPVTGGVILIVDLLPKTYRQVMGRQFSNLKKILICVEPAAVNPFQYRLDIQSKFGTVYVPTQNQAVSPTNKIWQSGYVFSEELKQIDRIQFPVQRNIDIGIINQNKFSAVRGELYSFRRNIINALARQKKATITVAGKDWTRGFLWHLFKQLHAAAISTRGKKWPKVSKIYRLKKSNWVSTPGPVDSEFTFLRDTRVALVIENESTYSSEKLVNALISGCTVVYVGPEVNNRYNSNLVVECRPEKSSVIKGCQTALANVRAPEAVFQLALDSGIFEAHDIPTANRAFILELKTILTC